MRLKTSVVLTLLFALIICTQSSLKKSLFVGGAPAKHPLFTSEKVPLLGKSGFSSTKTEKSAGSYLELRLKKQDSNATVPTPTSAAASSVVYQVSQTLYETTVEYIGPSVSDYADAVKTEVEAVNGEIAEASNKIHSVMQNETNNIKNTFGQMLQDFSDQVNDSTSALTAKIDENSGMISERIDNVTDTTELSYEALTTQVDKSLNETLKLERTILEQELHQEEELYQEMVSEINVLKASVGTAISADSPCSVRTDCTKCVQDPDCGWCVFENACVKGDSYGPRYAMCTFYQYQLCSAVSNKYYTSSVPPLVLNETSGLLLEIEEMVEAAEEVAERVHALEEEIASIEVEAVPVFEIPVEEEAAVIVEENGEGALVEEAGDGVIVAGEGVIVVEVDTETSTIPSATEFVQISTESYPGIQKVDSKESTRRAILDQ